MSCLPGLLPRLGIEPRGIVHVGAHEGQEVPAYRDAGFSRIVLVEPNPHLAAGLRALNGVEVVEAACAGEAGERTLHITRHDKLSSLYRPLTREVVETVQVPVCRLVDLIDDTVNVAVIDAQGAELEVIGGAPLDRLDVVVVETYVRPKVAGAPGHAETVAVMAALGWRVAAEWPIDRAGRNRDVAFVKVQP